MSKTLVELEDEYIYAMVKLNLLRSLTTSGSFNDVIVNFSNESREKLFAALSKRIGIREEDVAAKLLLYVRKLAE